MLCVVKTDGVYPGFHSMKRLGVLLLLLAGNLPAFCQVSLTVCWYPFILLKRNTVTINFLAEENNEMARPGLEPGPLDTKCSELTSRPSRLPLRFIFMFQNFYRVVVVSSESFLPSLLQLEQLINEGLAANDRCLSDPTPAATRVLIE